MLYSMRHLKRYRLVGSDGEIGAVHDLLFDDEMWRIRYAVALVGNLLTKTAVLVSARVMDAPEARERRIRVPLSREQVLSGTPVDADPPVSRQGGIAFEKAHGTTPFWPIPAGPSVAVPDERNLVGNPHLRSLEEVVGYRIQASDGEIGHVEDFVVEDEDWRIRDLVIDPRNWLPSRKHRVPPQRVGAIQCADGAVSVGLDKSAILSSPEYDPRQPVNRSYEEHDDTDRGRPVESAERELACWGS